MPPSELRFKNPETNRPEDENVYIEKNGIKYSAVESLRRPVEIIVAKIKKDIDEGSYGLIIGDDASARIVTLIFKQIIDKVYKKINGKTIETRFVALYGTRYPMDAFTVLINPKEKRQTENFNLDTEYEQEKRAKVKLVKRELAKSFVPSLNKEELQGKKILIITDVIQSGDTILPLIQALKKSGLNFDVVTIAATWPRASEELIVSNGADNFYYASEHIPLIYDKRNIAGVIKDTRFKTTSLPIKSFSPDERKKKAQETINRSREDLKNLADQIYDKTWN